MRKKKKSKFSAMKEVKAMARERVGKVPAKKVIPDPAFQSCEAQASD